MKTLWVLLAASGCASAATVSETVDFDALQSRQLSRFERTVASARLVGDTPDLVNLSDQWLAFANCTKQPTDLGYTTDVGTAHSISIRAADARRKLRIHHAVAFKRRLDFETLADAFYDDAFFVREANNPDDKVVWPGDDVWMDEMPAEIDVDAGCVSFAQTEAKRANFSDLLESEKVFFRVVDSMATLSETLENNVKVRVADPVLLSGIRYAYGALNRDRATIRKFKSELSQTESSSEGSDLTRENIRLLESRAKIYGDHIQRFATHRATPDTNVSLALAHVLYADEKLSEAVRVLETTVLTADATDSSYWPGRYLALTIRADAQQWERASIGDDKLPPRNASYFSAYAYRRALALKRAGHDERFLAVCKSVFRDRMNRKDPFVDALYTELLHVLAELTFGEETTELLEEFGPRGKTFERVFAYARVCLDRGRPENAKAAADWLLARHENAKFHAKYRAVKVLAAFFEDDTKTFQAELSRLVARSKNARSAIPKHRRPAFFKNTDAELTRVLQQMLPAMAEWGEGRTAVERRNKWLRLAVTSIQTFLRNEPNSLARPELLDLYRLASGLLETPRGYAERVGNKERRALILGNVRVSTDDLVPFNPTVGVRIPVVFSITPVPTNGPVETWPLRFKSNEDDNG